MIYPTREQILKEAYSSPDVYNALRTLFPELFEDDISFAVRIPVKESHTEGITLLTTELQIPSGIQILQDSASALNERGRGLWLSYHYKWEINTLSSGAVSVIPYNHKKQ